MSSLKEMVVSKRLVDGSTKEDIFHNMSFRSTWVSEGGRSRIVKV